MGNRRVFALSVLLVFSLVCAGDPSPAVSVPIERANRVNVTIQSSVSFDSIAGLYTYTYQIASAPASELDVSSFDLQFQGVVMPEILNVTSPAGWTFFKSDVFPVFGWAATEGPVPADFVDTGANIPPSPFQIKPGETLSGFSFQSPDPPDDSQFYVQGFIQPYSGENEEEVELELEALGILDFRDDSFAGTTVGPRTLSGDDAAFLGGRRPAVDGFLVFLNIADGDTRNAPVGIVIKFSLSGEVVDRSTFRAELNREDVTAAFQASNPPGDLTAVFALGSSPLKQGRNVLITSVDGIVPGTNRTATDTDRLTFTVP